MNKLLLVTLISLLFLSACSSQQKYSSANEAIKSLEKNITQIESPGDKNLDGVQPASYKLNNDEIIRVYDFGSEEKRDIGKKHFEESIQLLSSHAPIVYQSGKYLVLYYSHVDSKTRTPNVNETKYGEKIEKSLNSI
jgi:outer membrane murein-binding lipoprotein Lpp